MPDEASDATSSSDAMTGARLPGRFDEEEGPDAEHHRADEAGLKGPEEILSSGAEEQQR